MTTTVNLREHWLAEGYILVRNLLPPEDVERLRETCEDILRQCYLLEEPQHGDGDFVIRHLSRPSYHVGERERLAFLLETAAHPRMVDIVGEIFGDEPEHRCFSLFMNPRENGRDGNWHRDCQFRENYDEDVEKEMILNNKVPGGMQMQIALVPSDDSEYVPGSHLRWDTEEEYAIRLKDNQACNNSNAMPGTMRVALQPGDAVAFNAYGLHRGRYHVDRLRRTLMLTYVASRRPVRPDIFNHQPWFLEPGYLDGLSDQATAFYRGFVDKYAASWG
tara:strand:- start:1459 stop:2286 length:828 start_codon:yes stop_codon:yes gene_type:complete